MDNNFAGAVITFILGAAISFINYRLSDFFLKRLSDKLSFASVFRQALGIIYLAAAFFLAPYTPWDRSFLLTGAALGVTLPTVIFTVRLLRTNTQLNSVKKEDDNNG